MGGALAGQLHELHVPHHSNTGDWRDEGNSEEYHPVTRRHHSHHGHFSTTPLLFSLPGLPPEFDNRGLDVTVAEVALERIFQQVSQIGLHQPHTGQVVFSFPLLIQRRQLSSVSLFLALSMWTSMTSFTHMFGIGLFFL